MISSALIEPRWRRWRLTFDFQHQQRLLRRQVIARIIRAIFVAADRYGHIRIRMRGHPNHNFGEQHAANLRGFGEVG